MCETERERGKGGAYGIKFYRTAKIFFVLLDRLAKQAKQTQNQETRTKKQQQQQQ